MISSSPARSRALGTTATATNVTWRMRGKGLPELIWQAGGPRQAASRRRSRRGPDVRRPGGHYHFVVRVRARTHLVVVRR
jgi:hypothetical protein